VNPHKISCCPSGKLRLNSPLTVEMKDIAVATLGGSSAIASILLVFVGFMIMKVEGLPSETADTVIAKYRHAAKWGLLPFLAQSIVIFSCYMWMFYPNAFLQVVWTVGFAVAVILFIAYSVIITMML
jgi:hypothetical protein